MAGGRVNPGEPEGGHGSGDMRSLVVRTWFEPGAPPHLRARVVEIAAGHGERPVIVTTSVDEVCRAVRNWLEKSGPRGSSENGDGAVTRGG
jgi:hypothetical protein